MPYLTGRRPTTLNRVSPKSPTHGSPRRAAVVNDAIRDLVRRSGGRLRPEDRRMYEQLVAEWVAASVAERSTSAALPAMVPAA